MRSLVGYELPRWSSLQSKGSVGTKLKPYSQLSETAVDSATPGRNFSKGAFDSECILKDLIRRYRDRRRPITVNFRRIVPALNSPDRFAHLIHPYPAKVLFHIPLFFLANEALSKPGDIILTRLRLRPTRHVVAISERGRSGTGAARLRRAGEPRNTTGSVVDQARM